MQLCHVFHWQGYRGRVGRGGGITKSKLMRKNGDAAAEADRIDVADAEVADVIETLQSRRRSGARSDDAADVPAVKSAAPDGQSRTKQRRAKQEGRDDGGQSSVKQEGKEQRSNRERRESEDSRRGSRQSRSTSSGSAYRAG
ncbi:unnamed protein product [Closterium sp. NIES-54]